MFWLLIYLSPYLLLSQASHSLDKLVASNGNQTVFPGQNATFLCQFETTLSPELQSPQHFEYRDAGGEFLRLEVGGPSWDFAFGRTGNTTIGPDIVNIYQVSLSNHGLAIRCTFSHIRATAYLYIYQPPTLSLPSEHYEVVEGDGPLLVRFETGGYPEAKYALNYTWYHNGSVLAESPTLQLTASSLNLSSPHRSNHGYYIIHIYTVAGNTSSGFYVNVTFPPENSGEVEAIMFGVEGENKDLVCGGDVRGNPMPTFSWRKIEQDNTTTDLPSLTNTLTLHNITSADSGLYVCTISNHLGHISISTTLTVYIPSPPPTWGNISVTATRIFVEWIPPLDTQGLSVDLYEISIIYTLSWTTLLRVNISGEVLRKSFPLDSGVKIYPDTNYTILILAYTLNSTIGGQSSPPFSIKTLVSSPILNSASSRVVNTYILLRWEVFSSGKFNTSIDYYVITISRLNSQTLPTFTRTVNTYYTLYQFESHSFYKFQISGVRNGTKGKSIETRISTNSEGIPPTPLSISTGVSNGNNMEIKTRFPTVRIPYATFQTLIHCKETPFSVRNTHQHFEGGILTIPLNIPFRDLNCKMFITNKFGNRTYNFTFSHLEDVNTTTNILTTISHNTTTPPQINLPQIISISILILIVLAAFVIACILFTICYFCKQSVVYKKTFSYKRGIKSKSDEYTPKNNTADEIEDSTSNSGKYQTLPVPESSYASNL